jgi:hypothetical protein
MFVHGGLKYCGRRSIFLVSICNFRGIHLLVHIKVLGLLVEVSSSLVGFKKKLVLGDLGC